MTNWAARARAHVLERGQDGTAKTDETPHRFSDNRQSGTDKTDESLLLSVSSVHVRGFLENDAANEGPTRDPADEGLSSVSSVGAQGISEKHALDLNGWDVTGLESVGPTTVAKLRAASQELDRRAAGAKVDLDADCWPQGSAMNTAEIESFGARVQLFRGRGVSADMAETLADKLVQRDRELDDRRICVECTRFTAGRRCEAWKQAGIGGPSVGAIWLKLQRCPGFEGSPT